MSIERDQLPRPWPFPSTDPRMTASDDEPQDDRRCTCICDPDWELSPEEKSTGKCDECGRPFV